jgi:broad specificity phosphatase PhoE
MTTLFLIRHGDNDYLQKNILPGRLPGVHLNNRGREQAKELARTLCSLSFEAIYSSPLERAIETAEPLANLTKINISINRDLADTDVGKWAGRTWKRLRHLKAWKSIQETPSQFCFPGGESFIDIQSRIVVALDSIAAAYKQDDNVAVFFHADPIKLALAHYLGMQLDNFQRLTAHTGSVAIIRNETPLARVLAVNLIPPFSLPIL